MTNTYKNQIRALVFDFRKDRGVAELAVEVYTSLARQGFETPYVRTKKIVDYFMNGLVIEEESYSGQDVLDGVVSLSNDAFLNIPDVQPSPEEKALERIANGN